VKNVITILFLTCFIPSFATAQSAPANRLVDWKKAGMDETKKYATTIIDMHLAGADSNGIIACDTIINTAIQNNIANGAILFFPNGKYLCNSSINLPSNFVIKGNGSNNTQLLFDGNGAQDFITMQGTKSSTKNILKFDLLKNNFSINTDSILINWSATNPYLLIGDNDSANMFSTWAYGSSAQIFKVINTSTGMPYTSTLDQKARRNFKANNQLFYQYIIPIFNAGVECIKLKRLDSTIGQTSNIVMYDAVNCWVKGVESELTNFAHILINESKNCEVTNSWFHDAWRYGDGGQGYGVVCQMSASDNVITNNIFNHLRHSILLQAGANGNVYAYNYSTDPNWVNIVPNSAGDIAIHGNYPYCNLLEGNIVSHIWSDNSHGKNGPFNTFLRNRATNYGLTITSGDSVNLIGNEIVTYTPFYGNWNLNASVGHYIYGNQVVNSANVFTAIPAGSSNVLDTSFAFNTTPSFLQYINKWPLLGYANVANTNNNSAKDRFATSTKTVCKEAPLSLQNNLQNTLQIYPNPANDFIYIDASKINIPYTIYNFMGVKLKSEILLSHKINISNLIPGFYILQINHQNIKFEKQ
jgi:hypothetical protein